MENQENNRGKSPWRFLFAGCALLGGGTLLVRHLTQWLALRMVTTDAAAIGIIGGADGPTAVFVTTTVSPWAGDLAMAVLLVVGILGCFLLRRR